MPSIRSRVTLGSWFPHMTDTPWICIWNRTVSKEGFSGKKPSSKTDKKLKKKRFKKFNGCEFWNSCRKSPANGTASSPEKCYNSSHINGLIWGFYFGTPECHLCPNLLFTLFWSVKSDSEISIARSISSNSCPKRPLFYQSELIR